MIRYHPPVADHCVHDRGTRQTLRREPLPVRCFLAACAAAHVAMYLWRPSVRLIRPACKSRYRCNPVSHDFWSCKSINSRVNIVCDNEKPLNFKLPGPSPRLQSKPRHASRCGLQRTLLGAVQLCKCSLVLDLQKSWQVFLTRSLDCSTTNDFRCYFDCVQLISSQFLPCIEVCSLLCTKCFCVSLVRLGRYD